MAYGDDNRQKMGNQNPYAVAKGLPPIPTSMPTAKGPARPGSLPPLSPQQQKPQAQTLPKPQPQSMPQGQAQQPMGIPSAYASYAQPAQPPMRQPAQVAPQVMRPPAMPSPDMVAATQQAQAQQAAQAAMSMGLGPMQAMGGEFELPMGQIPTPSPSVDSREYVPMGRAEGFDEASRTPFTSQIFREPEVVALDSEPRPGTEGVPVDDRDVFSPDGEKIGSTVGGEKFAEGRPKETPSDVPGYENPFDAGSGEYPSDLDGDGTISESEFQQWMTQKSTQGGNLITDEMLADQMESLEKGYGVAGAKARQQTSRQMGARGFGASGMAAGAIAQVDAQLEADLSNAKTQLWMDQKKANWAQQSQLLQNAMQMAVQDKNIEAQKAISDQLFDHEREMQLMDVMLNTPEKILAYIDVGKLSPEASGEIMEEMGDCFNADDPLGCVFNVLGNIHKSWPDGSIGEYGAKMPEPIYKDGKKYTYVPGEGWREVGESGGEKTGLGDFLPEEEWTEEMKQAAKDYETSPAEKADADKEEEDKDKDEDKED